MNLEPINQIKLYGLTKSLDELFHLYDLNKLPSKILLSGQKGIGKCTLAYHLINYVLSHEEDNAYDKNTYQINIKNRSFKLVKNGTSSNFNLIDVKPEKKSVDVSQIRDLINLMNKSSFNNKPRFILIDNIEYLNLNSINALLKFLEEPNQNVYFILIHNNSKILKTLKSI
jgi:DNA polymerase-3 subunit delta'